MFKKHFMVEILVKGHPSLAMSTEFPTCEEAEVYAKKLCVEMDSVTSYRVFECGWGTEPRTASDPEWTAAPTYMDRVRSTPPLKGPEDSI